MTKTYIYLMQGGGRYYVGKANDMKSRLSQHKSQARNGTGNSEKNQWIRDNEHRLSIHSLEKVNAKDWREREKYWINKYRKKYGHKLMNSTNGGDGPLMVEEVSVPGTFRKSEQTMGMVLLVSGIILCFTGMGIFIGIPLIIFALTLLASK